MLSIYRNRLTDHVIFHPSSVDHKGLGSLHAYATDDGRVDIISTYTVGRKEVASFDPTEITKEDGTPAGSTVLEVVNYLNGEFDGSGTPTGAAPAITSSLTASVTEGSNFRYTITATNTPYLFLASGLPLGLSCHPTTGVISGVTGILGLHNILITAINAYGSSTQTLALTVLEAGGYHNTYSVLFRDHIYQNHLAINTSAAINHGSADAWSMSFWVNMVTLRASDFFSQGSNTNFRYIGCDELGHLILKFVYSDKERTYTTTGALAAGSWRHVVVAYDGAGPSCAIYINGASATATLTANTLVSAEGGTADMRIGRALRSVWCRLCCQSEAVVADGGWGCFPNAI